MKPISVETKRKLAALGLGVAVVLIVCELLMRLVFFLGFRPSNEAKFNSAQTHHNQPNIIHIVTLGESTTDQYLVAHAA
ncbi:MAG: hypothetical protein RBT63_09885 [Bdellovibrionales bacterium]|nr:hypothetical protein [Bdellovibrionales bacterium]